MQFNDPQERAEYARDIYYEVRNICESFRYRARNLINDYEHMEDDVENLLLELASNLEEDDSAGRVEDPAGAAEIPY